MLRILGSVLIWLWLVVPVAAQRPLMREHLRQLGSGRFAVGLDLAEFAGRVQGSKDVDLALFPQAAYRIGEVVLEAGLPLTYVHERDAEGATYNDLVNGNPWLSAAYLPDCDCGLSRLELGIAPDLAHAGSPLDRRALALARATGGDFDGHLWRPDLFPLFAGVSTLRPVGILKLRWDGDVILGLPGAGRDTEFGFQTAGDAGLELARHVVLGARAHLVVFPTLADDVFQSAVSAYLRLVFFGYSAGVRYLVNLDPLSGVPAGFVGASGLAVFFHASF